MSRLDMRLAHNAGLMCTTISDRPHATQLPSLLHSRSSDVHPGSLPSVINVCQTLGAQVYTRDQQITTSKGIIMARLRSSVRELEVALMKFCFDKLGAHSGIVWWHKHTLTTNQPCSQTVMAFCFDKLGARKIF